MKCETKAQEVSGSAQPATVVVNWTADLKR
jgi:hypothetical protein